MFVTRRRWYMDNILRPGHLNKDNLFFCLHFAIESRWPSFSSRTSVSWTFQSQHIFISIACMLDDCSSFILFINVACFLKTLLESMMDCKSLGEIILKSWSTEKTIIAAIPDDTFFSVNADVMFASIFFSPLNIFVCRISKLESIYLIVGCWSNLEPSQNVLPISVLFTTVNP